MMTICVTIVSAPLTKRQGLSQILTVSLASVCFKMYHMFEVDTSEIRWTWRPQNRPVSHHLATWVATDEKLCYVAYKMDRSAISLTFWRLMSTIVVVPHR